MKPTNLTGSLPERLVFENKAQCADEDNRESGAILIELDASVPIHFHTIDLFRFTVLPAKAYATEAWTIENRMSTQLPTYDEGSGDDVRSKTVHSCRKRPTMLSVLETMRDTVAEVKSSKIRWGGQQLHLTDTRWTRFVTE